MDFYIGDLLSIRYFSFAGSQTCQLFENDLMATRKRSKEKNLFHIQEVICWAF